MSEPGCGETIEAVWQQTCTNPVGDKVIKKIDTCGRKLAKWSKTCFQNVKKK